MCNGHRRRSDNSEPSALGNPELRGNSRFGFRYLNEQKSKGKYAEARLLIFFFLEVFSERSKFSIIQRILLTLEIRI